MLKLYAITQFVVSLTQILYDMEKEVKRRKNVSGIKIQKEIIIPAEKTYFSISVFT